MQIYGTVKKKNYPSLKDNFETDFYTMECISQMDEQTYKNWSSITSLS